MNGARGAVRVVLSTAPTPEAAEGLVRALVEERLIACGSVVPGAVSIYRWRGEVRRDGEMLLLLKTTEERIPVLLERLATLHPYEVPEALVLEAAAGHPPYLAWVAAETAGGGDR